MASNAVFYKGLELFYFLKNYECDRGKYLCHVIIIGYNRPCKDTSEDLRLIIPRYFLIISHENDIMAIKG